MVVGRLLSFWGPAFWQVRTVSFRECSHSFAKICWSKPALYWAPCSAFAPVRLEGLGPCWYGYGNPYYQPHIFMESFGFFLWLTFFFQSKNGQPRYHSTGPWSVTSPSAKQTIILDTSTNPNQILPTTKYKSKNFPTLRHPNTSKYLDPPKTTPKTSGDIWMSREHTPDPNHQQLMNNFSESFGVKKGMPQVFFRGPYIMNPKQCSSEVKFKPRLQAKSRLKLPTKK